MVLPLVVAGVAMAVGAVMQYYNSEKARGATKEKLAEIEALFNKIKPPDIDLKVYDDPKIAGTIPPASFDFSKITPEEYKLVANIAPEAAPYVAEKAPQLVKASAAATAGRDAQLEALRRYKSISQGEDDPQFQQLMLEASRKSRGDAQSRQATVLDSFARRGVAGPGAELALQSQGASDAMQTQAITSQAAAADAYKNRLNALAQGAQLGGNIRTSEMSEAKTNADIINDYNQRSSSRYQEFLNNRANMTYDARVKQEMLEQDISNRNVSTANDAALGNVERANKLAQQQLDNRLRTKSSDLDVIKSKQGAQQQIFDNQYRLAAGKTGNAMQGVDYINQNARDQNQAIQGVTDSVAMGAAAYGGQKPQYAGDPYDEGTTSGKWRKAKSDVWRTA